MDRTFRSIKFKVGGFGRTWEHTPLIQKFPILK
jgi:hypothetical protein